MPWRILIFGCFFSCFALNAQVNSISVDLYKKIGAFPTATRAYVYEKYAVDIVPEGVPSFLKDYRVFEIPLSDDVSKKDNLLAVCGLYQKEKIIIIDANRNNDLSDDRLFNFPYDQQEFLGYANRGVFPEVYTLDKSSKLDRFTGNELLINYTQTAGEDMHRKNIFVEVLPNFIMFPSPDRPNYEQLLAWFDYTFLLLLAEHRTGEFSYHGKRFQIYIQQDRVDRSFERLKIFIREKAAGVPVGKFEETIFYPYKKIIMGDDVFDISVDPLRETATLTAVDSRQNYEEKLALENQKVAAFEALNFLDGKVVGYSPELTDQPTLIHFWGSWCGPCKKDMPILKKISTTYGDDLGLIGIASESSENLDLLLKISGEHDMDWPQICEVASEEESGIVQGYNVKAFPTYVLIDDKGKLTLRTNDIELIVKELQTMIQK
ncbi:MAG: TlpA disulfide reductase family protein [Saprospiraceae bacterium]